MSVKQEQNGTWTTQFWYQDLYGKRKHKCKRGFGTEQEAQDFEDSFKGKKKGSMKMRFADFVEIYFEDMEVALRDYTRNTREYILNGKIIPFFGHKKMKDITTLDIIAWQNELLTFKKENGEPYSETYLRTVNTALSAVLSHASRFYGLKPNPMVKAPKIGSKEAQTISFWTKDEYLRFSETLGEDPLVFIAFELLYWTGIRLGELLALRPDDFDFVRSLLHIRYSFRMLKGKEVITEPKTPKSVRDISMPEFLRDEVRDVVYNVLQIAHDERIFAGLTGAKLKAVIRMGCAKTGVPEIRVHDLRHSHVSLLIEMGFSAVAIADRSGHESTEITLRYGHMFPNTQDKMADALEDMREGFDD